MNKALLSILLFTVAITSKAQSCQELMEFVKSESYGTTYTSYYSESISKVTFYETNIDYTTYYFAVVCFKKEYSSNCTEYIYQVGSSTKWNYSLNYINSAGKAFNQYIRPYSQKLGCSPN